jgi:hypothetical protein
MRHQDAHPDPQDDCFGCKCLHQAVQVTSVKHNGDEIQKVPVVAEAGHPRSGEVIGHHHVHPDGRVDAVINMEG